MTRPMFWGPTARMMMVMPIGISIPPPRPCRTRKITSSGRFCATPHAIDASVKSAMVTRYRRLVPKRSLAQPAIGMTAPCASMYPVTTHEMSAYEPALRSTCRVGIAMLTMVASRIVMIVPSSTTPSAIHL